MRKFLSRNRSNLLFAGLLILMFFAYRYPFSTRKGPMYLHAWRQSDCASFALNYAEEGIKLFEPKIMFSYPDKKGRVASEFPVIYIITAVLWKVFGHHDWMLRGLNLLVFFTGLYYLYLFLKRVTGSSFWSMLVPLMLFSSPVLAYYSNNFLMNVPSFGLVLVAWYYYWQYIRKKRVHFLYIAMTVFMFAGLLKATALLLFTALMIMNILGFFPAVRRILKIPEAIRPVHIIPYILVIGVNLAWILWTIDYNSRYLSDILLRGIFPVWELGLYDGLWYGTQLTTKLTPSLFHRTATVIIVGIFIWLLLDRRRSDPFLLGVSTLIFMGCLAFILLFFKAFSVHDYYLTNLLIFIPLVSATILHYLKTNHPGLFMNRAFRGLSLAGVILMIYTTMVIQRAKYDCGDTFVKHSISLNEEDRKLYIYMQDEYERKFLALETITPYLRELGIGREDPVICMGDLSPNLSLYLMNQRGVTEYGLGHLNNSVKISHYIDNGFKYMVICDPAFLKEEYMKPFLRDKIGQYRNVSIFDLRNLQGINF